MKEFVVYTLSRLGLFMLAYALVTGVLLVFSPDYGFLVFWPILAALVLSSIASVYLLRGQRDRFAAVVERRATAATSRFEAARAREDDAED